MSLDRLKELEDDMKKCFRCSLCKMIPLPVIRNPRFSDGCPANRFFHVHGYSGSGKSIMSLSLLDGRIKPDQALARTTLACTTCGLCDVACKFIMDAERHLINMALRETVVDRGLGHPSHVDSLDKPQTHGEPSQQDRSRSSWARSLGLRILPEQRSEVLLLPGSPNGVMDPSTRVMEKMARLLSSAKVTAGVLVGPETDTGLLAYWAGHRNTFTQRAEAFRSLLKRLRVRTVVALSGADLGMLRSKLPEYGYQLDVEVLHASELLEQLVKHRRLRLNRPVKRRVTYHDPCYLGRQSEPPVEWNGAYKTSHGCMTYADPPRPVNRGVNGVFDAPRNLIRSIKGIHFQEMCRIREYAFCCGGGGGVPLAYPAMARATALHRIQEARAVGADCVLTACHVCLHNLTSAQADTNSGLEPLPVLDLIDLVYEAAGFDPLS